MALCLYTWRWIKLHSIIIILFQLTDFTIRGQGWGQLFEMNAVAVVCSSEASVCSCNHSCNCGCLTPSFAVVLAVVPGLRSPFVLALAVVDAFCYAVAVVLQLCLAITKHLQLWLQLFLAGTNNWQLHLQLCLVETRHLQLYLQLLAWCGMQLRSQLQLWRETIPQLQFFSIGKFAVAFGKICWKQRKKPNMNLLRVTTFIYTCVRKRPLVLIFILTTGINFVHGVMEWQGRVITSS